jgi:two-component system response regulator AtoC
MLEATSTLEASHSIYPSLWATANRVENAREESADPAESSFLTPPSSIQTAHLLVIGENLRSMAKQLREVFPGPRRRVHFAGTGRVGLEHVRTYSPDVILLDVRLADQSGLDVYQQIRSIDPRIPVIFVSNAKEAGAVIEVMKQGAYDCLLQPLDLPALRQVVTEALDVARHMRQSAAAEETIPEPHTEREMVGFCPAMQEVYKAIGLVAAQDVPVLITGESGTGKELVARAICQHGPRAQKPFLALNCAAIPENLLESELFGHEKGAFTGADRRRIGKFEQCDGGPDSRDLYAETHREVNGLLLPRVLEYTGGNQQRAARLLGISRKTLSAKLRDLGLHVAPSVEANEDDLLQSRNRSRFAS